MRKSFTVEEDNYLRENVNNCLTLYDLTDMFNTTFPEHQITYCNLQKRLSKMGIKKGTHNVRKGVMPSKNPIGTVICSKNHGARVKTEDGYVPANTYFRKKYFDTDEGILVNLNGNKADFSRENVVLVSRAVHMSLCWRGWFFTDPELTKTAILTAELLLYFPELTHNENQYYRMRR